MFRSTMAISTQNPAQLRQRMQSSLLHLFLAITQLFSPRWNFRVGCIHVMELGWCVWQLVFKNECALTVWLLGLTCTEVHLVMFCQHLGNHVVKHGSKYFFLEYSRLKYFLFKSYLKSSLISQCERGRWTLSRNSGVQTFMSF